MEKKILNVFCVCQKDNLLHSFYAFLLICDLNLERPVWLLCRLLCNVIYFDCVWKAHGFVVFLILSWLEVVCRSLLEENSNNLTEVIWCTRCDHIQTIINIWSSNQFVAAGSASIWTFPSPFALFHLCQFQRLSFLFFFKDILQASFGVTLKQNQSLANTVGQCAARGFEAENAHRLCHSDRCGHGMGKQYQGYTFEVHFYVTNNKTFQKQKQKKLSNFLPSNAHSLLVKTTQ